MSRIGRYMKFTARDGRGDELADLLLTVANGLGGFDGCEVYVINRSANEPDVVWVTELWLDQAAVDASLASPAAKAAIPTVMALLAGPPERTDLLPIGGVGISTG